MEGEEYHMPVGINGGISIRSHKEGAGMDDGRTRHYASLQEAVAAVFGNGARIVQAERVFGGDINQAYRLTLADGRRVFLKANRKENAPFFAAEAAGLAAIAGTGEIGTPQVFGSGEDCGVLGGAFLMMEFVEQKKPGAGFWEAFGRQLARMHQAGTEGLAPGGKFGFLEDNFIGAGRQVNTPHGSWVSFFRDCRLLPQLRQAARYLGSRERHGAERLLERLDEILEEPVRPSLLHGDLWSGNFLAGADGRAWLIDPAAYVGHAEADLAMTELFGGFPQRFYDAYREEFPVREGYPRRREVYNLYHLLNHLNLFGSAYLAAVKGIIQEFAP